MHQSLSRMAITAKGVSVRFDSPLQTHAAYVCPVSNRFILCAIYVVDVSIHTWRKPVSVRCHHGDSQAGVWSDDVITLIAAIISSIPQETNHSASSIYRFHKLRVKRNTHKCHRAESKQSPPSFHSSSPTGSDTARNANTHLTLELSEPQTAMEQFICLNEHGTIY